MHCTCSIREDRMQLVKTEDYFWGDRLLRSDSQNSPERNKHYILFNELSYREMNELEHLRRQLDLIIGFLDVSDRRVYEMIKTHDKYELGLSIDDLYGNDYNNFQSHITNSALILGFTHLEDFLTKMIRRLLIKHSGKNKIKVTIDRFEQLGEDYKEALAEEQSKKLTFAEKIKLIKVAYHDFDEHLVEEMTFVNKLRNCLMHNNGFADERLEPKFMNGDKIILTSGEIHRYGLVARRFGEQLWKKVN